MFDEHGLAVVTDFGIAKAASGGKLTGTGMSIGTPHYMSPEQARAQALDGRSDIYSLGVVAYQSLIGRSEEHTSELQSHSDLVCRLLLEKKKKDQRRAT